MRETFDDFMERRRYQARRRLRMSEVSGCSIPGCSECDPLALTGVPPNVVCYEHQRIAQGFGPNEAQHPATRAIEPDFTVDLAGNDHRVITVMSEYLRHELQKIGGHPFGKDLARLDELFCADRRRLERYGDIVPRVLRLISWLEAIKGSGWWKEYEEWCQANDVE